MPYKKLTKEQMNAVEYDDNLLLTACPGSGKTKTLVSKLAYIIENKDRLLIGKRKVIALTYTNIAADTITERLMSYGISDKSVWVGTIHSFCLQWIIKPNINLVPRLSKGYVIIDEHEKEKLINDLKEKYDFGLYDNIITSLSINYQCEYLDKTSNHYKLVDEYHQYLRENKYIDFELILNISYRLLNEYSGMCGSLAALIHHVLIDEYQDTSTIQYEILRFIIEKGKSKITLIGDQEQAIYTGLGAEIKNKEELIDYFKLERLEDMALTGCFRSSQRIIDFYKKYQDGGIDIQSKSLLKDFKSVVHIETTIDKSQLSNYIHEIIQSHLDSGLSEKEIVILCPSWFDVMQRSRELDILDKDYSIDGLVVSPIPKSNNNMWLDLVSLALTEPSIENYLKRKMLANTLSEHLKDCCIFDTVLGVRGILKAVNRLDVSVDQSIETWIEENVREFCSSLSINIDSNMLAMLNLNSLLESTRERINKYDMQYRASDLERFFGKSKGIKITTCHSTKGDEYDIVICTGLLEGKIPHWNDVYVGTQHANYVARRLLYVIGSRARKHLYMISERGHQTKKRVNYKITPQL